MEEEEEEVKGEENEEVIESGKNTDGDQQVVLGCVWLIAECTN